MTRPTIDTEDLIQRAARGDPVAREELLGRHRARLRQMIAVRLDRRLLSRIDPSDVVQETLGEACQKLPDYLRNRPLPFYPWLRQLAWERLIDLQRRHIYAQKRSVTREEHRSVPLPDESAADLASRLLAPGSSPSKQVLRAELLARVQAALAGMSSRDQEILVMRHLEQMSINEIAAVLDITEGAVKTRHLRALLRLRDLLGDEPSEKGR